MDSWKGLITIIRLGSPENASAYWYSDDAEIITKLHQNKCMPEWKDLDGTVFFKKSRKLEKMLKKLGIDMK